MAGAIGHGEDQHMLVVASANLHRFTGGAAKIMHFMHRDAHEIQRASIGEAVMIEARTKPDAAIVVTGQHVLFHKVVNDRINGRKRCLHRLGNGVGTGRSPRFVQMVNDLNGAVDAADARAPRLAAFLGRRKLEGITR